MEKILQCYPFKDAGVKVAEGFAAYDGNLRTVPGEVHQGIDYALRKNNEFASFEVFSMFEGDVRFGVSEKLGRFFVISVETGELRYDCVYAHLDHINEDLQKYAIIRGEMDFVIPARYSLGWAGTAGSSRGVRHLHIEIHEKNLKTGQRRKLDPYGVYGRLSGGGYRQPGESLAGLDHIWISDQPDLVS